MTEYFRLPDGRQSAIRGQLVEYAASHPVTVRPAAAHRRRRWVTLAVAVGAMAGAGGIAVASISSVSDHESAQCFSVAAWPGEAEWSTTISASSESGISYVASAVDACSALWRQGIFEVGHRGLVASPTPGEHEIPGLVSCVLTDGRAGVFPGPTGTCEQLGLIASVG
jgi:hypothetical protein